MSARITNALAPRRGFVPVSNGSSKLIARAEKPTAFKTAAAILTGPRGLGAHVAPDQHVPARATSASATAIQWGEPQIKDGNVIDHSPVVHNNGARPRQLGRNRIAIDRHQRASGDSRRRTSSAIRLRSSFIGSATRSLQLVPVGLLGVALELLAFAPHAVANAGGLGSQFGVVQQLFDVPHPVGPLTEPFAPDRSASSRGKTAPPVIPAARS